MNLGRAARGLVGVSLAFTLVACGSDSESSPPIPGAFSTALRPTKSAEYFLVDRNNDGPVTLDELVAAVNAALSGCPRTRTIDTTWLVL